MHIALVSLFPEMFVAVSDHGVTGRAVDQGLVALSHHNPRDFTVDKHRTVDDRPYGGGPGMLMKIDPLQQAIAAAKAVVGSTAKVVYLSPQGQRFDHSKAVKLAQEDALVLVAGRYEGIDERLIDKDAETARLSKEIERLQKDLARIDGKLTNPKFVDKAPPEVVDKEREKQAAQQQMLIKLEQQLHQISTL